MTPFSVWHVSYKNKTNKQTKNKQKQNKNKKENKKKNQNKQANKTKQNKTKTKHSTHFRFVLPERLTLYQITHLPDFIKIVEHFC